MTETEIRTDHVHRVTDLAGGIAEKLLPYGVAPDAVFEGLLKAASVTGLKMGLPLGRVADLIEDYARDLRAADPGRGREH